MKLPSQYSSQRLTFEPLHQDPANQALIQELMNTPSVHASMTPHLLKPFTTEDSKTHIEQFSKCLLCVIICLKSTDGGDDNSRHHNDDLAGDAQPKESSKERIGFMMLYSIPQTLSHNRHTSLGIVLSPKYQSKGYGTEALNWLVDWGFRYANLHSIGVQVMNNNPRALHVYTKMGFIVEGRSRESIWFDRRWYDTISLGMLESEWEAMRGRGTEGKPMPRINGITSL